MVSHSWPLNSFSLDGSVTSFYITGGTSIKCICSTVTYSSRSVHIFVLILLIVRTVIFHPRLQYRDYRLVCVVCAWHFIRECSIVNYT